MPKLVSPRLPGTGVCFGRSGGHLAKLKRENGTVSILLVVGWSSTSPLPVDCLTRLGRDIEIVVRPAPRSRREGKIR